MAWYRSCSLICRRLSYSTSESYEPSGFGTFTGDVELRDLPVVLGVGFEVIEELFDERPTACLAAGHREQPAHGQIVEGVVGVIERHLLDLAEPGDEQGHGGLVVGLAQE